MENRIEGSSSFTPPSQRKPNIGYSEKITPNLLLLTSETPLTRVRKWVQTEDSIPLSNAHRHALLANKLFKEQNRPVVSAAKKKRSSILLLETFKEETVDELSQDVKNTDKLKPEVQTALHKKCSYNGAASSEQMSEDFRSSGITESASMREFYSYLKIDTNPSARKSESSEMKRRFSKRFINQTNCSSNTHNTTSHSSNYFKRVGEQNNSSSKEKLGNLLKHRKLKKKTLNPIAPDPSILSGECIELDRKKYVKQHSEEIAELESPFVCKIFHESAKTAPNLKCSHFDETFMEYVASEKLQVPVVKDTINGCNSEKENVLPEKSDVLNKEDKKKLLLNGSYKTDEGATGRTLGGINNNFKLVDLNEQKSKLKKRQHAAASSVVRKYSRCLRSGKRKKDRSLKSFFMKNSQDNYLIRKHSLKLQVKKKVEKENSLLEQNTEREICSTFADTVLPKQHNNSVTIKNETIKVESESSASNEKVQNEVAEIKTETSPKGKKKLSSFKTVSASDFSRFEEISLSNIVCKKEESSSIIITESKHHEPSVITITSDSPCKEEDCSVILENVNNKDSDILAKLPSPGNSSSKISKGNLETNDTEYIPYDSRDIEVLEVNPNSETPSKDNPVPSISRKTISQSAFMSINTIQALHKDDKSIPVTTTRKTINYIPKVMVTNCLKEKIRNDASKQAQPILSEGKNEIVEIASSSNSNSSCSVALQESTSNSFAHLLPRAENVAQPSSSCKKLEQQVLYPTEISLKRSKYISLSDSIEPKLLYKSLVQTKRTKISMEEQGNSLKNTQNLFNDHCPATENNCKKTMIISSPASSSSSSVSKQSPHSVYNSCDMYGAILHAAYLDNYLILAQERAVRFWNQSALGHMLDSQDMWVPYGLVQRLILGDSCVYRPSKEMVVCCDESVAYLELWTKEHKSEKREQPIADVFVTVYFWKRKEGKKVLQLENIKGSADSVQYIVMRHSKNIVVSWRVEKQNQSKTLIRSYLLEDDFQSVKCTKELKTVDNVVVSLHNIEMCDTLVLGAGENIINIWNLEFGYLVATVQLQKLSYQPSILWVNCDRGYLFLVQQFMGSLLQLVAINGLNYNWKSLQTYRVPNQFNQRLQGIAVDGGLLIGFFESNLLCWNIQTGRLIRQNELDSSYNYVANNQHVIIFNEEEIQIRKLLSYLVSN